MKLAVLGTLFATSSALLSGPITFEPTIAPPFQGVSEFYLGRDPQGVQFTISTDIYNAHFFSLRNDTSGLTNIYAGEDDEFDFFGVATNATSPFALGSARFGRLIDTSWTGPNSLTETNGFLYMRPNPKLPPTIWASRSIVWQQSIETETKILLTPVWTLPVPSDVNAAANTTAQNITLSAVYCSRVNELLIVADFGVFNEHYGQRHQRCGVPVQGTLHFHKKRSIAPLVYSYHYDDKRKRAF